MVADTANERTRKTPEEKANRSSCGNRRIEIPLRSFLNYFTLERFKKNPDLYRKRIFDVVNNQYHHAQATIGLLRCIDPELHHLERQLGFLNIKCRTFYERFAFNRQLRTHAEQILSNFDLSVGKTIDEAVLEAPPLLKNSVRLYQTRWRNAVAISRWQQDIDKAMDDMANIQERYKRFELELEAKRVQLQMCKKIRDIKADLDGLSDKDKQEKMKSVIGDLLPLWSVKQEYGVNFKRSLSSGSLTSVSSDESCWDDLLSDSHILTLMSQNSKIN